MKNALGSCVTAEGGEVRKCTVWSTGEWGAGGSAPSRRVITEMEMRFIELQQARVTSAERL